MAGDDSRGIDQTPTWAVSVLCAIIIIISIALEKILHKVGTWLTDRHKKALYEALEKIKAELMILGFISLILVFSQYYIADICIPTHVVNTMLPCPLKDEKGKGDGGNRRLLWYERRILAGDKKPECKEVNVVFLSNIVLLLIK
ncbi:MLO 8 [Olea europaea subsp. europaea]|uniref:MLO 8 n=1 Tax=Olea europaea subsp. europaea TaxID=158383 RepID=A0A8S0T6R3_OLEEU|nr:MLO 8 [Olea europaea subsp. europaea]